MNKRKYYDSKNIYEPKEVREFVRESVGYGNLTGNNKGTYYYNVPASFDIETSSFYRDLDGTQYNYEQVELLKKGSNVKLEKVNIMYIWQLGINGRVMLGRTWDEFIQVISEITRLLELDKKRRLVLYVHNLSYEFQYIRHLFKWAQVFSMDIRKPLYAVTDGYIEFRCSYLLSGYSLNLLASKLRDSVYSKLTGDLDYTLVRHSTTQLTKQELQYCINDVKIVMEYVQELLDDYRLLTNLPLTKTGFVRRYCRDNCLYHYIDGKRNRNLKYMDLMAEMTISDVQEFDSLSRAFMGGFTHANANYSNRTIEDVSSYDFDSSYPYVMVAEKFPMSAGVRTNVTSKTDFYRLLDTYCCVFDIEFVNLITKQGFEHPLSSSKCIFKSGHVEDNGRIVSAERVITTITEIDFEIFSKFYSWDDFKVGYVYCYKRGYLPTEFINSILELYEKKTTLKGVAGRETEYALNKEMLNSCYGMTVTNPLRDEVTYVDDWVEAESTDKEKLLYKYNTSKNRFLYYPWGVYITAYARRNLFTAVHSIGEDYVYSDTDSIKIVNAEKHKEYFDAYDRDVVKKLMTACNHHGIDISKCYPSTNTGEKKMLGLWDFEGLYSRFKTLGAKRYMIEESNALRVDGKTYSQSLTVSGVNKYKAIPYLHKKYGAGIFDAFSNYLQVPPEYAGKNIHTYIDYIINGKVTDYKDVENNFIENSSIHLEPTGYTLSLSIMYLDYLLGKKLI